ncbi:MAG: alcohol dehydrogenase catalytic domain-containing protein, partial [Candidatus Geothermarchaeales archaeon]
EVLVGMKACGICGTDMEKVRGHSLTNTVLGHEVSGIISEVGEGVETYRVGERVAVHHHVSCGNCRFCRTNRATLCSLFASTNIYPGGFSEFFRVPRENVERGAVIPLDEEIPFQEGSLLEPAGCCVRALSYLRGDYYGSALIVGAGPVGLIHLQLLKLRGVDKVLVSDPIDFRLKTAEKFGADGTFNPRRGELSGRVEEIIRGGVDVSIIATGSLSGFYDGWSSVRPGGEVLQFGAPPLAREVVLDLSRFFLKEICLFSSYSTTESEMEKAKELLMGGSLDLEGLVTHAYSLDSVEEAFRTASDASESIKVMVESRSAEA